MHIIGPMASELIAEAVVAMEFAGQRPKTSPASATPTRPCRKRRRKPPWPGQAHAALLIAGRNSLNKGGLR